jgi:hypothetical protein
MLRGALAVRLHLHYRPGATLRVACREPTAYATVRGSSGVFCTATAVSESKLLNARWDVASATAAAGSTAGCSTESAWGYGQTTGRAPHIILSLKATSEQK